VGRIGEEMAHVLASLQEDDEDDEEYEDQEDEFDDNEDEEAYPPLRLAPERSAGRPVSRNAPCPCGSGKKYKRCCLGRDT
jgi:preprotein translocase subunit SecA